MSKKFPTNIEFVTKMMDFSEAGALKQAFIIEAIRQYAEQTINSKPWDDSVLINHAAWVTCAKECKAAIESRQ